MDTVYLSLYYEQNYPIMINKIDVIFNMINLKF